MNTTVIIRLIVIRITYSGSIALITTPITATATIIIITAYIIIFNFRNISINIIIVFISIVINTGVIFIKAIFNIIIDNDFIDYIRKLYVDNNYSI